MLKTYNIHLVLLSMCLLISCGKKGSTPSDSTDSNQQTLEVKQPLLLETKLPRNGKIWSLDWSPDGKYIACGNASGLLRIYDSETLELTNILTGFTATINGISWRPDGKKIVASGGNDDPRVIVWDLERRKQIIIDAHKRQVRTVRWSPNGSHFASTSHDGTIKIWTAEGEFIQKFEGANGGCVGIDWLDEDKIAASCWDNTIRIYTLSGKDSLLIENGNHRRKAVLSVDWHPNGKLLATGDYGNPEDSINVVKIWSDEGILLAEMSSHEKGIRAIAWNNRGDLLASGGETVRLWNKEGKLLNVFDQNTSPVWALDWNPGSTKIATGHNDGKIRIWNSEAQLLGIIDGHSSDLISKAFNQDSSEVFLGFADGSLRYYNLGQFHSHTVVAHSRSVRRIKISNDETSLALNSNDGTCSIWNIIDGNKLEKKANFGKNIYSENISWNPENDLIAFLHNDTKISIYSQSGEYHSSIDLKEKANDISWKDGLPTGVWKDQDNSPISQKIYVQIKNKNLELIPLNHNRFALIDRNNKIIHGDKKDFIKYTEVQKGFTKINL